jgi:hypothetical protein
MVLNPFPYCVALASLREEEILEPALHPKYVSGASNVKMIA